MYELIQVGERTYYIQCPAKIGLVTLGNNEVCLIDSGNDKDAGKKVLKILNEKGWKLKAIFNTHSNADHIGGNKYLQTQTGCKIYAPGTECAMTRHPILEPAYLYGGCPPKQLRHKFLLAAESNAEYLTPDVLPEGFEIIELPGHFFDMVGYRTPDGTVFLADCLSSRETLEKYRIGVIYDVAAYLDTLVKIQSIKAPCFVPSHAAASQDICELAQFNIDTVNRIAERIVELCAEPVSFESLLQQLFTDCNLTMTAEQYVLVGSTVRSYLSWLSDSGKISFEFKNNTMLWKRS